MIGFPGNTCGKSIIYFDPEKPFADQNTSLSFQCQKTTQIEAILSVGIIKTRHQYDDYEISTLNQCYLDDGITDFEAHPEMEYFNTTLFKQELLDQCKHKTECVANMSQAMFMPPNNTQLFQSF